nr:PREDICTED: fucolectin-like [Anolis carolinensis]|eukprot:XP_016853420.1 PREDICTED: fucolectin-like [Anolis carolinensis]
MLQLWLGLLATLAILVGHGEASACKPAVDGIVSDLAKGRPARQSSDYGADLVAGKAVDGNCQGNLLKYRSCSHTKYDLDAWWYVDLGEPCSIASVVVKNRGDCCSSRIQKAEIRVGGSLDGNGKSNPLCEGMPSLHSNMILPSNSLPGADSLFLSCSCGVIQDTSPGSISVIQCNVPPGRYVSIHIPGRKEYLTLCEVEVFGAKVKDVCRCAEGYKRALRPGFN